MSGRGDAAGRVLVVDDEPAVRFTLRELLGDRGLVTLEARSAAEALPLVDGADVVLTDLEMGEVSGLVLLREIRERAPELPVILLTAHGSERVAVRAIKEGAYDYLSKPFNPDELLLCIGRALETRRLRAQSRLLHAERALNRRLVGRSAVMQRLLAAIERVAPRDITILVRGDTGTGKELVASLVHAQSRRARGPLVRFNCAAIPAELAESELFGHHKGAFTGAHAARRGFLAQAHGGTLVLDEVAELPAPVQGKLLRFLQEGEIQALGSGRIERVDVRVVACTHRDLRAEVQAGRFREDLYYRLAVLELRVPPLAERREDIAELAQEFVRRYASQELDRKGFRGERRIDCGGTVEVRVLPPVDTSSWTAETVGEHADEVRQLFVKALADWPVEAFDEHMAVAVDTNLDRRLQPVLQDVLGQQMLQQRRDAGLGGRCPGPPQRRLGARAGDPLHRQIRRREVQQRHEQRRRVRQRQLAERPLGRLDRAEHPVAYASYGFAHGVPGVIGALAALVRAGLALPPVRLPVPAARRRLPRHARPRDGLDRAHPRSAVRRRENPIRSHRRENHRARSQACSTPGSRSSRRVPRAWSQ